MEANTAVLSRFPDSFKVSESTFEENQDCLFLSGVNLHLCCCTPEEQLQLVRIAREGCALRHAEMSSSLTHIVVRSRLNTLYIQHYVMLPTFLSTTNITAWHLHLHKLLASTSGWQMPEVRAHAQPSHSSLHASCIEHASPLLWSSMHSEYA